MDFWQQMKTHNARIWCTTPEYMWTMLKEVIDGEMPPQPEAVESQIRIGTRPDTMRRTAWEIFFHLISIWPFRGTATSGLY
jgi:hypothetical protein